MRPGESLESLSREQLLELLSIYSKNWQAMDGVWFQSVEGKYGMKEAMYHDVEAWKRFTVTEARRIKKFLNLPEYPGLEGLEQALQFRFYANLSHYQLIRQGDTLLYRVLECRVQQARTRKNLGLHPCKPAGLAEYAGFAKTIDGRITCQCLSCCPEVTDPGCACAWLFRLKGENSPAATGEFAGLSGKHGENFRQNDGKNLIFVVLHKFILGEPSWNLSRNSTLPWACRRNFSRWAGPFFAADLTIHSLNGIMGRLWDRQA